MRFEHRSHRVVAAHDVRDAHSLAARTARALADERACETAHGRGSPRYVACIAQSDDAIIDDGRSCANVPKDVSCYRVVARPKHPAENEPIDVSEVIDASGEVIDLLGRERE